MSAALALACIEQLGRVQQAALDQGALAYADGQVAWLQVAGVRVAQPLPRIGHGVVALRREAGALQVRPASRLEQQRFLAALPRRRGRVVGFSARALPLVLLDGDTARSPITPLRLAPALRLLEQVVCRCDGPLLLFEQLGRDQRRAQVAELRQRIASGELAGSALPGVDRTLAAACALATALLPSTERDRVVHGQLERALQRGGGQLLDWHRGAEQLLAVRWQAGTRTITSMVEAATLAIVSAGLCVSGRDRDFDLTTLAAAVARPAAGDRSGHDAYEYGY